MTAPKGDRRRSKPRRRGRPSGFRPAIDAALIQLVINQEMPIKHAAWRRLGWGCGRSMDWLECARCDGAAPELIKWAGQFTTVPRMVSGGYPPRVKPSRPRVRPAVVAAVQGVARGVVASPPGGTVVLDAPAAMAGRSGKTFSFERTVARLRVEGERMGSTTDNSEAAVHVRTAGTRGDLGGLVKVDRLPRPSGDRPWWPNPIRSILKPPASVSVPIPSLTAAPRLSVVLPPLPMAQS